PTHAPPSPLHTLSLHDALPICPRRDMWPAEEGRSPSEVQAALLDSLHSLRALLLRATSLQFLLLDQVTFEVYQNQRQYIALGWRDRKSTRLNSSHVAISYAVFC